MRKQRKHNCIFLKGLAAFMAGLLALLCLCPAALAIDPINVNASCTLTVHFRPGEKNGDGAEVQLYRVANMTGFGQFTPVGRFASLNESMNGLVDDEWDLLARKLMSHAGSNGISPMAEGTVRGGKVVFEDLPVGLYMITYGVYERNNVYFITDPQLVSLPNHSLTDPDAWQTNIAVYPKSTQIQSAPLRVQKLWVNTTNSDQKPVTVHLLVKGVNDKTSRIVETVVLSSSNSWRADFYTKLKPGDSWSVAEATQLSGFYNPQWDWNWDGNYINIYVTNHKKPPYTPPTTPPSGGGPTPTPSPTPPPNYPPVLPQTGLLWWPVPVLAMVGMLLFAMGWARRRRNEEN